ncbi:hypothetical protein M407DRAFT_233943 [Tulasnella calospora MUT 4182]|uniref:Uncharacterized protein n=2 Tax=Tulasnella calospora MUT 4182 TaxID=1051891 RepID=A0A0C3Q0U2_9AGAM|nr:hypothetical protein M407DRAFT_233943 [Tulasnella calospora MUT 4182]
MLPTTVSGTRLNSAEPSDIEFLSSFLTDLAAVVAIKGGDRMSLLWRNLDSVKAILSEALGYRSVEEESEQLELESDTEDETWVEYWGVQELLEWMLLEVRRAGLPDEKHVLQGLIGRLEQR